MAQIRAVCPECRQDVDLNPHSVVLVLKDGFTSGTYGFVCPNCHLYISKPADDRAVQLLLAGGVVARGSRAQTPLDAGPVADPVSWDDVLDFMLSMERDDWMVELGLVDR